MIACLHDATTERVARVARVVRESTLAQLRELDVGAWKSEAFRGEKIPTLPDVLALVPPGKLIYVEVKCGPEIVPQLVETLRAGPPTPEQITIIAFSEEVVRHLKDRAREFSAYWLVSIKAGLDGAPVPPARSVIDVLRRSGADGVGLSANPAVDAVYVSAIKNAGFRINVWTVNDPAVARRFVALGVDSITTDPRANCGEALVQTRE